MKEAREQRFESTRRVYGSSPSSSPQHEVTRRDDISERERELRSVVERNRDLQQQLDEERAQIRERERRLDEERQRFRQRERQLEEEQRLVQDREEWQERREIEEMQQRQERQERLVRQQVQEREERREREERHSLDLERQQQRQMQQLRFADDVETYSSTTALTSYATRIATAEQRVSSVIPEALG
ncbi:MAG: hypothetical protein MHM6MM_000239 [Cercozoa sp. M6MM]